MGAECIINIEIKNKELSFKCTYDIKECNKSIQILNNTSKGEINKEIEKKIKILENDEIQNIYLTKKFEKVGLHTINFVIEEHLENMSFMFKDCSSLKKIEFISFETIKVKYMISMFQGCIELENLDLSNFNTKNVIDMQCMFNKCHKLKAIKGLTNLNTSKVINMSGMFQECDELEYLDLSNFNTENVKDMQCMFNKCLKLKEIKGINNLNTSKVINMNALFQGCKKLKSLDLSQFNTSKVIDMGFFLINVMN